MTVCLTPAPAAPPWGRAPLYLTPPSSPSVHAHLDAGALGAIITPASGNHVREGWWWAADNGVFSGSYPGDDAYLEWLCRWRPYADRCLFVVAPDVVADHHGTYARARQMLPRIRDLGYPAAFVAQNGFEYEAWYLWDEFDALFIGGTTAWKLGSDAALLARTAHDMGKWVHMGRVNSHLRLAYADAECWADSVDGTYLTYGPDKNLPRLLSWTRAVSNQETLF
ncbi:hypothetical protein [Thermomonospora cellulosilytica]|uniref:Uncharacterized protein n=1 Tax=Thermomonospora cellulosilytica TaxID=1411118 RepID=A0A7W3N1M4_9ACTN|nr:hypothetical protein [Thermomonospora cellulosilytica]MBA9005853.1 hypothetical protein [Thermomonospora cellulosilytica]